jgi:hypothetical protein
VTADPGLPAGTATRLPLSDISRKVLRSKARFGQVMLFFAVLATAGIIVGAALATPGIIAFLPLGIYLWWCYYSYGIKARQDLRAGTEEHYDGPWKQQLVRRFRRSDVVRVQLPILSDQLTISSRSIVNALIRAGLRSDWSPASGQIAYTTVNHQALTVAHRPDERIAAPPPPNERELHGLLDGERERVLAMRRAQALQKSLQKSPEADG